MTIIDIENMSAADLKAQREQAVADAKSAPVDDLAARYVQARLDAKTRDEKLGEQGVTITLLHDSLRQASEQLAESKANAAKELALLEERAATAEAAYVGAKATIADRQDAADKLKANCIAIAKERDAAQSLATARRAALATIMQTIAPLLAQE